MATFTVISDVGDTLLGLLRDNLDGLIAQDHVSLASPADIESDTAPRLSLFLYQINENRYLKNEDIGTADAGKIGYPGLPLNLFYLLTAYAQTRDTEHQILGRTMQIFHDHAVIRGSLLRGSIAGTFEEIIVALNPISLEDMNRLWSIFPSTPYRLSITYQVSTALIDSTRERSGDRVIERVLNYSQP